MQDVWSLLRGKAPEWLRRTSAYRSGAVRTLQEQTDEGFGLDGEILEPDGKTDFTIKAGPPVSFLYA